MTTCVPVKPKLNVFNYVDSSEQQLHFRLNIRSPITSPTIISLKPHYSNEIESDTISKGDEASGHEIHKRSPLVVPEDPFLVGGFLKKLYLPKVVKAAQLYPKVHPFVSKKLKPGCCTGCLKKFCPKFLPLG